MTRTAGIASSVLLGSLQRSAVQEYGVSAPVAQRAARATARALGEGEYDRSLRRRAQRYFWTVVRRLISRDPASADACARFFLAAVIADLRESGRTAEGVWDEVERGWSGRLPAHVLDEYRERLIEPRLTA
jgi:hypothetical protein